MNNISRRKKKVKLLSNSWHKFSLTFFFVGVCVCERSTLASDYTSSSPPRASTHTTKKKFRRRKQLLVKFLLASHLKLLPLFEGLNGIVKNNKKIRTTINPPASTPPSIEKIPLDHYHQHLHPYCDLCHLTFQHSEELDDHNNQMHCDENHFQCPICWTIYQTKKHLEEHQETLHPFMYEKPLSSEIYPRILGIEKACRKPNKRKHDPVLDHFTMLGIP